MILYNECLIIKNLRCGNMEKGLENQKRALNLFSSYYNRQTLIKQVSAFNSYPYYFALIFDFYKFCLMPLGFQL